MDAFSYTASVKLTNGPVSLAGPYAGVTDLNVSSREFLDYNECITSCSQLMDDVKTKINLSTQKMVFKVSSEINPIFSGEPTLSKDWDTHEVARLWIFDEKMEITGKIQAIGQARIFQILRSEQRVS